MPPVVSIVVPTFNRRASLERLLKGIAEQTYPAPNFEVIVVDDGSQDGTVPFLRALSTPYSMLVLEQAHQGPAAARNLGVAHAKGSLIVFLDDDVVPIAGLLSSHVVAHSDRSDMVVVGPMLPPPSGWRRPLWVRWEEEMLDVQYRAMIAGLYPCTPRQFYTGNVSLSRQQFIAAGGFDVRFRRAEDVELGFRLHRLGARFKFDPSASVLHYASRSFDAWCRTPYQYGRYDVVMEREKGFRTFQRAAREFHGRHRLNRLLARICGGHHARATVAILALRGLVLLAEQLQTRRLAAPALSAIFNLLYWQGVHDEFGDTQAVRRQIAAMAPVAQ